MDIILQQGGPKPDYFLGPFNPFSLSSQTKEMNKQAKIIESNRESRGGLGVREGLRMPIIIELFFYILTPLLPTFSEVLLISIKCVSV